MQAGMSMPEFQKRYGTEDQCEAVVMAMRWPEGYLCPVCSDDCRNARGGSS
jgi:hypothetical protein